MKRLSTTPARRIATKATLVLFAFVFAISVPISLFKPAAADQWDSQINRLQAQANEYQAQADKLRSKANTLQNKLDQINAQKHALEAKIGLNEKKQSKLEGDIAANKVEMRKNQDALGEILAFLYVDDKSATTLEQLASSESISDFIDKQEYRVAVRNQLSSTIDVVKELRAKLDKDKKTVDQILAKLDKQNKQLVAIRDEQRYLVNKTRGEEAAYQRLVSKTQEQAASARAQQQAYYASLLASGGGGAGVVGSFQYWGWSGNQGCGGGGYPYCGAQDSYADPWNLYNRECVSYVAWAIANRFHRDVQAWHGDGNAYEWPSSAPRWSGAWRVYDPRPGDAVVLPMSGAFAPIGHLMVVESVSGDNVFVSQYNFYGTGEYSTMWIKTSGVIFLRFPG